MCSQKRGSKNFAEAASHFEPGQDGERAIRQDAPHKAQETHTHTQHNGLLLLLLAFVEVAVQEFSCYNGKSALAGGEQQVNWTLDFRVCVCVCANDGR